jgi:hypothetical protein
MHPPEVRQAPSWVGALEAHSQPKSVAPCSGAAPEPIAFAFHGAMGMPPTSHNGPWLPVDHPGAAAQRDAAARTAYYAALAMQQQISQANSTMYRHLQAHAAHGQGKGLPQPAWPEPSVAQDLDQAHDEPAGPAWDAASPERTAEEDAMAMLSCDKEDENDVLKDENGNLISVPSDPPGQLGCEPAAADVPKNTGHSS